jgi:hypothetical protein
MDANERRMLREMANDDGLSEATVVRQLIRKAYRERQSGQPKKKQ